DGYQYDFEDYVGLKRPSDMVDSDRIVSYDILRWPRRGWTAYVAYDEEYHGPVTGRSDILRIEFKHRFRAVRGDVAAAWRRRGAAEATSSDLPRSGPVRRPGGTGYS